MFLADQRVCPVGIGAARRRLADLAAGGWLGEASAAAYQDGLDHLLSAWPPGEMAGAPRLVQAHFLDPVHWEDSTTMGMRWEAAAAGGELFPALDANITLDAENGRHTRMTLTGVYRSAPHPFGAGVDQVLMHQVATATIRSLLTRISSALEATGPAAGDSA
jgi:hypothetical protein